MRFEGKVAFVTGAARGIGEVYARALAENGAAAVIADLDLAAGEEAAERIRGAGCKALAVQCDVADEHSIKDAVARSIERFGGIDILVNNAAKHLSDYSQPPTRLSLDHWRTMLAQ